MKQLIVLIFLLQSAFFTLGATNENEQKKFYKSVEVSYATGLSLSTNSPFDLNDWDSAYTKSLRISAGWFFNPYFSAGVGFGADRYEQPGANTFPLYVDFRGYLRNHPNTAFAFFDIGKAVSFKAAQEKRMLLDAGLGYQFRLSQRLRLTAKGGYSYFKSEEFFKSETGWNYMKRNSLRFTVGLVF